MNRWKLIALTLGITATSSFTAFAGTWKNDAKGWWYQQEDGIYPADTWLEIDNNWYCFNQEGYMKTGWIQSEEKWYYCKLNGRLATEQWIGGMYYVGSDGAMYTNTTTPDGSNVDENGNIIIISDENKSKEENKLIPKSQIIGAYEYDDGEEAGYYDGEMHNNHVYTLVLYENNTFEYTYDNYFHVYNESGTYTYNDKQGEIIFSDNPYITKGIIKDSGILISEYTDREIFFTSK